MIGVPFASDNSRIKFSIALGCMSAAYLLLGQEIPTKQAQNGTDQAFFGHGLTGGISAVQGAEFRAKRGGEAEDVSVLQRCPAGYDTGTAIE